MYVKMGASVNLLMYLDRVGVFVEVVYLWSEDECDERMYLMRG